MKLHRLLSIPIGSEVNKEKNNFSYIQEVNKKKKHSYIITHNF